MRGGIEKCVEVASISKEMDVQETQTATAGVGSNHARKVNKSKRAKTLPVVVDPDQDHSIRRVRYYRGRANITLIDTKTSITVGVRIASKQHAAKRKDRRRGGKRSRVLTCSSPVTTPPLPIRDKPNATEPIPGDPPQKQKPDPVGDGTLKH
jgi:hypothetical protein